MANQEHLDILKQGVEVWNQWRKEHKDIWPELRGADLSHEKLINADFNSANLSEANLIEADLTHAILRKADLSRAYLNGATLNKANLNGATLNGAFLSWATLIGATLIGIDLTNAKLTDAKLRGAYLIEANLSHTQFNGADLTHTHLKGAILSHAGIVQTIFGDVDLSVVQGLETVHHNGPSTVGIDTIIKSHGHIPEIFLRKAGVPQSIIEQIPALIGSLKPIDYYTCFISYSSKDQAFVERLYADLQSKGVRCWFAPEDLKIGEKFWHRIDESIRLYDKLLVVLSEHSVTSVWVENEVMATLEKEQQQQKLVLFPIKLDESVMQTNLPWAANIRRSRHIGDFTKWKHHDDYQKAFNRLLRDLKASS